jgi:hypothetical protein
LVYLKQLVLSYDIVHDWLKCNTNHNDTQLNDN